MISVGAVGNLVAVISLPIGWVQSEVRSSLVCGEVDCQLGWYPPWQSGRVCIRALQLCSSGMLKPQQLSSYCPFSCQ